MHPIEAFKGRQTQNLVLRKLLLADAAKKGDPVKNDWRIKLKTTERKNLGKIQFWKKSPLLDAWGHVSFLLQGQRIRFPCCCQKYM